MSEEQTRVQVRAILKWAGGKGRLLPALQRLFPPLGAHYAYYEPFLGSGAMFFSLQHPRSHLADTNAELVNMYEVVRGAVDDLIAALRVHVNEKDYYYQIRAQNPAALSAVERAARLIYLNKTCYNGLYRVNGKGQFNVPFGAYTNPTICDAANLRAASLVLQSASLMVGDCENCLRTAQAGDFIYLDPPYHPLSKTASFTSYTADGFGAQDQARLANMVRELTERGCYVMQSNSDAPLIRDLYADFRLETITANRAINSKADRRGPITELVILNYVPSGELLDRVIGRAGRAGRP